MEFALAEDSAPWQPASVRPADGSALFNRRSASPACLLGMRHPVVRGLCLGPGRPHFHSDGHGRLLHRIPLRTSPGALSRRSREQFSPVKHAPALCDIGWLSPQGMGVFKQASSWNRTRPRRRRPRREICTSLRGSRVNKAVEPDSNPSFLPQQNHGIDSECFLCRDPRRRQPDEQHGENDPAQHQRIFRRRLVHDRGKQLRRQYSQNQSCH